MSDLINIDGVGERVCEILNNNGIYTINDLIKYFPIKYNILKRSEIDNLNDNDKVVLDGNLDGQATLLTLDEDLTKIILRLKTGKNVFNVAIYNNPELMENFKMGCELTVIGFYNKSKNSIVAEKIKFEKLPLLPVIEPIYKPIKGISNKQLNKYIMDGIAILENFSSILPQEVAMKYNFPDKKASLIEIHNPNNIALLKKSRQRIKYEEIFYYLISLEKSKKSIIGKKTKYNYQPKKFLDAIKDDFINLDKQFITQIIDYLKSENNMKLFLQTSFLEDKINLIVQMLYYNYLCGNQSLVVIKDNYINKKIYSKLKKLVNEIAYTDKVIDNIADYKIIISNNYDYKFDKLTLVVADVSERFVLYNNHNLRYNNDYIDYLFTAHSFLDENIINTLYYDLDVMNIINFKREVNEIKILKANDLENIKLFIKMLLDSNKQIFVYSKSSSSFLDSVLEKMEIEYKKVLNSDKNKEDIIKSFVKKEFPVLIANFLDYSINANVIILNGDTLNLSLINDIINNITKKNKMLILNNNSMERLNLLLKNNDSLSLAEYDFINKNEYNFKRGLDIFRLTNINKDFNMIKRVSSDLIEYLDKDIYIDIY